MMYLLQDDHGHTVELSAEEMDMIIGSLLFMRNHSGIHGMKAEVLDSLFAKLT